MEGARVAQLRRFAVKSMQGESLDRVQLGPVGVRGDRTHGLVDLDSGKVASAKDPRRWAGLLDLFARPADPAVPDGAVIVRMPDGREVASDDPSVHRVLSEVTGRAVELRSELPTGAGYDYVWEVDGIAPAEVVTGSQIGTTESGLPLSAMPMALMAPGTFQDVSPITLLTTTSLAAMARHHPDGDWDPRRFRANILVDGAGEELVEDAWVGHRIEIGDVVLEVSAPTPRCVMTTLPQLGLRRDRTILRTVARENMQEFVGLGRWACLGVYANVVTPGEIALDAPVRVV